MINKSIFKSYDVRGIYPSELNVEAAFAIGKAFVAYTGAKHVVVGHDGRLSSPVLFKALAEGLFAGGSQVTTIGQTPTEGLYFALANYTEFEAGIMITASHNPKEYNGFKMMKKSGNDIIWIRGTELAPVVNEGGDKELVKNEPLQKDIWPDYVTHMQHFFDVKDIKSFKIVVDASNGVMGNVIEKIKAKLPCEIIPLNFTVDGNFPNHSPNPLEKDSVNQIAQKIQQEKADFGIMFDGDGDRIFLVNELGQIIKGDTTLALLARHFLEKKPGMGIAYNAICSRAVAEFVTKWGGVPVRTAVGFVNVREGLIKNNGIMGGEVSCHYCFKDYWYMDSGMIAFLTLLQIISKDGRKVSEVAKELSPYFNLDENFQISDKDSILQKIKEKYADGKQDYLDGVTVAYKDWWFNARPSNTEPLLRLTIEADNESLLEEKKKELTAFLAGV